MHCRLEAGATATETELRNYAVIGLGALQGAAENSFRPMPKTATGKVQKYVLRRKPRFRSSEGLTRLSSAIR